MKKFVVFQSGAVDSNSVGSADDGTNLDLAAFDLALLQCMTGTEDTVELTFAETGMFHPASHSTGSDATDALENSLVILTVAEGKEADVVKDLAALITMVSSNTNPAPVFDAVNSVYPINNVTGVQIRRHLTLHAMSV